MSLDEVVVCDRQGGLIWRRELTIERAGLPCEPNCHLDTRGVLWVYLPTGDRPVMEAVALVSDEFVLLAVDTRDEHEEHLLLATRTLTCATDLYYGLPRTHNSIAATDGHGRWITSGHRDDTVRLWQLPDPIDAIPRQRQLR